MLVNKEKIFVEPIIYRIKTSKSEKLTIITSFAAGILLMAGSVVGLYFFHKAIYLEDPFLFKHFAFYFSIVGLIASIGSSYPGCIELHDHSRKKEKFLKNFKHSLDYSKFRRPETIEYYRDKGLFTVKESQEIHHLFSSYKELSSQRNDYQKQWWALRAQTRVQTDQNADNILTMPLEREELERQKSKIEREMNALEIKWKALSKALSSGTFDTSTTST